MVRIHQFQKKQIPRLVKSFIWYYFHYYLQKKVVEELNSSISTFILSILKLVWAAHRMFSRIYNPKIWIFANFHKNENKHFLCFYCLRTSKQYNWSKISWKFKLGIREKMPWNLSRFNKVSLLEVDSLWGDCMFIPADWGS